MPTIRIDDERWSKLETLALEEGVRRKKPIKVTEIVRKIIDSATINVEKRIKTINKPDQKGDWSDYWIAVCDGEIADGETEERARKNLLNQLKDMH